MLSGDDSVLEWWPDKASGDLRPVNQDLMDEIGDLDAASDKDAQRYFASIDIWTVRPSDTPSGPATVLSTYADLAPDEIGQPDVHERVRDRLSIRVAEARKIVTAIEKQMSEFYEVELPETLRTIAGSRRRHLENLGNLFETLGLPVEWKTPMPAVLEVADKPPADAEGLPVHTRWRLDPVSYAEIQRIIRLWAHSVEDDPAAYTTLREDHVSSLLAATLNATTSGAGREVYSRGGKTDIRIRADVLGEDKGSAAIFVLENKWVDGSEDVSSAVEDQLMRYVPVAATSTIFLALSRNQDFQGAVQSIHEWARAVPGYLSESEGPAGWPIFTYQIAALGNLEMEVCIATVSLAPVPRTRAARSDSITTTSDTNGNQS